LTMAGVHRFGNLDINATSTPVRTERTTLPAGTLYIPLAQGTKHWIQAVLGENPYLPFNYFYDEVTWSYSLLRGFAGDGFLTRQPPPSTKLRLIGGPELGSAPRHSNPVYAFNTDSAAALAMVNQLLGQGASVSRASAPFAADGVSFDSGAALVSGIDRATVERVAAGPGAEGWDERSRLLLTAADELGAAATISEPTWTGLAAHLDERQLIELPLLVGYYTMVAYTLNSLAVAPEPGLESLPS